MSPFSITMRTYTSCRFSSDLSFSHGHVIGLSPQHEYAGRTAGCGGSTEDRDKIVRIRESQDGEKPHVAVHKYDENLQLEFARFCPV